MKKRSEQGSIVLVYGAMVGLLIVGGAVTASAFHEHRLAQRTVHEAQAFYLAEAGLDNAIVQLRTDPDYAGTAYAPLYDAGGQEIGGYDIAVEDIGNNQREITIQGHYPEDDPAAAWYAVNTVQATATVGETPIFTHAVFASQDVTISGSNVVVDSFDSRNGAYGGGNVLSNGDVGSNGTSDNVLDVGNSTVNGDAEIGVGGDPNTAIDIGPQGSISGSQAAMESAKPLDAVEVPGGLTNQGDLSVSGNNTVTLGAGTYYYDDLSISGNGQLVFSGAVTLYVSGQVSISGNGITTAGNTPTNLLIYVENNDNVNISGNGNFYGAIYAPLSDISVSGNGSIYGAVIGTEASLSGNGDVHYDEALGDLGGGTSEVSLDLWALNPSNS